MAQPASKADRIRKLLHLSNAEIAKRVGVSTDYIRAVRQRTSESGRPINGLPVDRWRRKNRGRWLASMRDYYVRVRRPESRAS